jgi:PAS domain-containing protein
MPSSPVEPRHDGMTGALRYRPATDHWWWSDEVFRLHGFEPGEVVPTTAMIAAHQHPDDRDGCTDTLARAARHGGSFACVNRIVDGRGRDRVLALVGEAHVGSDGRTVDEITGHFADVTSAVRRQAALEASRQIHEADRHRAVIEQAKGIVAARTGLAPDEAFELLRTASMQVNTKVHDVAGWVVRAAVHDSGTGTVATQLPWPLPDQRID